MAMAFVPDWELEAGAHPNKRLFSEGLALVFARWAALQMAVGMETGGAASASVAQGLHGGLLDYFEAHRGASADEVEDILLEVMARDLSVELEDGSERTTAAAICALYRECVRGSSAMVDALRAKVRDGAPLRLSAPAGDSSSDDGSASVSGSDSEDEFAMADE